MKKYFWVISIILIAMVLITGFFLWRYYQNRKTENQQTTTLSTSSPPSNPSPTSSSKPAPTLVYPILNFVSRATENLFGSYFPSGGSTNPDLTVCPTATYYSGYHTAVDIETNASEANSNISIFAIAAGTVREVSTVSGYGGLIVIQYNLGGADYTAYYGHVDLSTAKIKIGDKVNVGETLASLGSACSAANGNVRKHLHFGLHKGSAIDIRGYVPNKTELDAWVDPKLLLEKLGASQS